MMIRHATLHDCAEAEGTVVAIDVLRAFTTAAFAFAAGAERILLVGTVEEALALQKELPEALLMGEVDGLPIEGFDFGNSPAEFMSAQLDGRTLIQRTTAGTQGIVRSERAGMLLAAALTNASATARYLEAHAEGVVTLVETGLQPEGWGDEDVACANLIEAQLQGRPVDQTAIVERVRVAGQVLVDRDGPADLDLAIQTDRFGFAMPVTRENGRLVMRIERI
jgi:2-phosphosulfolactate phosphatase